MGNRSHVRRLPVTSAALVCLALAAAAPAGARPYHHPSGFAFEVPRGWKTTATGSLVRLIPRGASTTEMYFVGAQDASGQGIVRIDDPRVAAYLDQQVRGLSAAFARVGVPRLFALPRGRGVLRHQGLELLWQATGQTGVVVQARALACLVRTQGVMVIGIGEAKRLRRGALLAVLRSVKDAGGESGALDAPPEPGAPPAAAGRISHDAWGFSFLAPAGWVVRHGAEGALLGHRRTAGVIIVQPHQEASLAAVRRIMGRGLTSAQAQLRPTGRLRALGGRTFAGEYTGQIDGQPIRARVVGSFSPYGGGGAWVFAITTPVSWSAPLAAAADAIGQRLRFVKTQVTGLMRHFAGRWGAVSKHSQSSMFLAPNGQYRSSSESSYSGQFSNQYGHLTGSWGTAGQRRSAGRWTVRGTKRQGQLIIRYHNGKVRTYAYRVHAQRGRTYWREYWIGGRLHVRR